VFRQVTLCNSQKGHAVHEFDVVFIFGVCADDNVSPIATYSIKCIAEVFHCVSMRIFVTYACKCMCVFVCTYGVTSKVLAEGVILGSDKLLKALFVDEEECPASWPRAPRIMWLR
jgi:hypothetical protein